MTVRKAQRQSGVFEQARSSIETIANNIYYAIALSNHLTKVNELGHSNVVVTLDELLEIDFIIGNLVIADAIIQKTQKISA